MPVTKIGGQFRQMRFDILIGPIPASQRLDVESMPQVMEPGTTVGGGQAQSYLIGDGDEPRPYGAVQQLCPPLGEEEARALGMRADPVTESRIMSEYIAGGGMERDQPHLVALGVPNREEHLREIDVLTVQADGFTHAHARNGQQPE